MSFATSPHLISKNGNSAAPEPSKVDATIDKWSEEEQEKAQEKILKGEVETDLANINPEMVREREREYRDIEKHWVRKNVWVRIAKKIRDQKNINQKGRGRLRYLTLPAYYRLDVALLLAEDLLEITKETREGAPDEIYVAAFEVEATKYGRMVGQIPRFRLFGLSSIEDALTDSQNEYYHDLRTSFPFDLVNLDLTTSLTPNHEGPYSRTMKGINEIFARQSGYSPWGLFLTFRNLPSDWEQSAIDQLLGNLQNNIDTYPAVKETFNNKYHVSTTSDLRKSNEKECISQAVVKWLVDRAHAHEFKMDLLECYYYSRYNPGLPTYDIYKFALIFSKGEMHQATIPTKDTPRQSWMGHDLITCVKKHQCKDVEDTILKLADNGKPTILDDLRKEVDKFCALIK